MIAQARIGLARFIRQRQFGGLQTSRLGVSIQKKMN